MSDTFEFPAAYVGDDPRCILQVNAGLRPLEMLEYASSLLGIASRTAHTAFVAFSAHPDSSLIAGVEWHVEAAAALVEAAISALMGAE